MIYRILCEGREDNPFFLDIWEKSDEPNVRGAPAYGRICCRGSGLGKIASAAHRNRRARFYFTEAGWHKIGRAVLMDARRRGILVRVVRLKNPPLSQTIHRDKWQVANLPPGRRRKGGGQAERSSLLAYLRGVPLLKIGWRSLGQGCLGRFVAPTGLELAK